MDFAARIASDLKIHTNAAKTQLALLCDGRACSVLP